VRLDGYCLCEGCLLAYSLMTRYFSSRLMYLAATLKVSQSDKRIRLCVI